VSVAEDLEDLSAHKSIVNITSTRTSEGLALALETPPQVHMTTQLGQQTISLLMSEEMLQSLEEEQA
jgi:hypothetical protein